MSLSKREQARILESDMLRRAERDLLDNARLGIDVDNQMSDAYKIAHAPHDSHVNACLVKGIGMVSPPPKPTASPDCWNRGMRGRTVGIADASQKTATVKVTRDGITTIVPATGFGRTSKQRNTPKQRKASQAETARITLRDMDWSQ